MLICFAGIDGCGKSTQVGLLKKFLESIGRPVLVSKAYGEEEKSAFAKYINGCDDRAVLFLFQAMHLQQRLAAEKALAEGKAVIADRWDESYQVYHSNFGILAGQPELRQRINEMAFGKLLPDITFLIDLPVEEALRRCVARGRGTDFFDLKSPEYHETMRQGYLALARKRGWTVIDGRKEAAAIHQQVLSLKA